MFDVTLVFPRRNNELLLGLKKAKFGKGKWNGFGGKVESGESIEEAAVRELEEEAGISCNIEDIKKVAVIDFFFEEKPEWNQKMHVFFLDKWSGSPKESEEMLPGWFKINNLPYDDMWIDDIHWLPKVLKGEFVNASFTFSGVGEGNSISDMKFF